MKAAPRGLDSGTPERVIRIRPLKAADAVGMGYSTDKRRRRREHRRMARQLLSNGGFFSPAGARGTILYEVACWHLAQARLTR